MGVFCKVHTRIKITWDTRIRSVRTVTTTTMKILVASLLLLACAGNLSAVPRNQLTCEICVDIITDIDNFITSDTTEEEILAFFNQICEAVDQLLPGLGATCTGFLKNNGAGIIERIVNENLNPDEICTNLTACP